jgi:hypothetical protein
MATFLESAPRDLKLGTDNDLVVTTDLAFVNGVAAVAQACRIAVQIFAGEWFLDLDIGIPYWTRLLGVKPAIAIEAAKILYRAELASIDGVIDVTRLDVVYDRETRGLEITWQVMTAFGETPVDSISRTLGGAS